MTFELSPLTTTSGRPLHYGNAYLSQDAVRAEQQTTGPHAASAPVDWSIAERWLGVAGTERDDGVQAA
jgi:hypothetical protein